jgi:hypothetical protein
MIGRIGSVFNGDVIRRSGGLKQDDFPPQTGVFPGFFNAIDIQL